MNPVPVSEICADIQRDLATWRRVKSDGQIYRVRPDLIGDATAGDKVWISYNGLPMLAEVIK